MPDALGRDLSGAVARINAALANRYVIERLIGEGGMATVYLARDLRHERRVALKVLKPELGALLGVERFLAEIRITANLQHANLLPLFDSGTVDGLLFYVMPFVEGESLRARLDREKQLPVDEAVRIADAAAGALDYAHRHGVIHRDLKPENILLQEGQPLIADFGIALAVRQAGGSRVTQTGMSLGTPQYMSPEQAAGDREVDARTDIYSLGAVTYEMLTGEPPHTGSTAQAIVARLLTETPRPVRVSRPAVPDHVEAAVQRALEKVPADRFASAREFADALSGRRAIEHSATAAATRPMLAATPPRRARETLAWALAAVGVAAAVYFATQRGGARTAGNVAAEFDVTLPDSLNASVGGGSFSLALSPDGSAMVFRAARPGEVASLYLRHIGDREVTPIRGTERGINPVFSPDGSELIFAQVGRGGLRRVSLQGGVARVVIDTAAVASWGDGGTLVLTVRNALYTVPADGGERALLARPDSARAHLRFGFPDVLPGERAALVTIWKGGTDLEHATLGVVTMPGGEVTELGIPGTFPRYSSTGHIVYATTDAGLFAVPFDARARQVTGTPFLIAEGVRLGNEGTATFALASNGMLAYLGGGVQRQGQPLSIVTRDGAAYPLRVPPGRYGYPRVSPSGREIALSVGSRSTQLTTPRAPDVFRFDTASTGLSRITADSASDRPSWTPEGDRIAWIRPGGDTAIHWRALYSGAAPEIMYAGRDTLRDFSIGPATRYITLRVGDDVRLTHLDSLRTRPRPLLTAPWVERMPRVSPSGALVAYVADRTGRNEVYVRRISGVGADVQISEGGGTEPVWSREGNELFFRGPTALHSVRLSAGAAVTQRDSLFTDSFIRSAAAANYDVFPGGNAFVMVGAPPRALTTPPIVVLQHWHLRTGGR
jgi:serine/threonine-protein kinase